MKVKVSERFQIALPSAVRKQLNIKPGDHLLVDVQDGLIIMMPEPRDYVAHLSGLHKEVWAGVDANTFLQEERATWSNSGDE